MIGERIEIEGNLHVLSPLRIGSGSFREPKDGEFASAKGDDVRDQGLIATLLKDHKGKPYLPGSSLKGVLRRASASVAELFGPGSIEKPEDAQSGRVTLFNAYLSQSASSEDVPGLVDRDGTQLENGIFVETNVAIDRDAGVAAKSQLFRSEYVLPGCVFLMRISLARPNFETVEELANVLSLLAGEEGIPVGGKTRAGNGAVRLDPNSLRATFVSPRGDPEELSERLVASVEPRASSAAAAARFDLVLSCDGPFLIADPQRKREAGDRDTPQIGALIEFSGDRPRLSGKSLIGALRAQFDWFCQTRGGEAGAREVPPRSLLPPTAGARLFGTTDWRGRMEVARIEPRGAPVKKDITSVKLDRFSGAPIDNALFTVESWCATECAVSLELDNVTGLSPEEMDILGEDDVLFEKFVENLCCDIWGGLDIGYSTNSGFGWFSVRRRTDGQNN